PRPAPGPGHDRRRTRPQTVGRRTATHRHRPRPAQGRPHPDPGRGHLQRGRGQRVRYPAGPGRAHRWPYHHHDRAPPVHGPRRRPRRRHGRRPDRRGGRPRRPARPGRGLRPPGRRPGRIRLMLALTKLLGPHRWLLLAAVLSGIAHHLVVLASTGVGAWVVSRAITGASADDLRGGLIALGLLLPLLAVTPWLESYLAHVAAFRVLADVRGRVYAAFDRLAPGYLLQRRSGDLGAAAISDVEQLELWFAHTLSPLVSAATVPVAALTALGVFHPALALALAPVLVALALVPAWLRRRAQVHGAELRARLGELNAEAVDTIQGLRELITSGAGDRQLDRLAVQDGRLLEAKLAHGRRSGLAHAVTNALPTLGLLAALLTAALLVTPGGLDAAFSPVAVVLAATTFAPVVAVTDVARDVNLVIAAGDRIMTILTTPPPVTDRVTRSPSGPIEPRVAFNGVRFRYGPELPDAVTDITFDIAPGETVALVGHSGAGKSTCASLLMRLWDVDAGSITIGG